MAGRLDVTPLVDAYQGVNQWWDELQELGYDVMNMSDTEMNAAVIDAGLKTGSDLGRGMLSGLAGAGMTLGSLSEGRDVAVNRGADMVQTVQDWLPSYELRTEPGERLSKISEHVAEPVDKALGMLGDKALEVTNNPELATWARLGMIGAPAVIGAGALGQVMRQGSRGKERPATPESQIGKLGEFEPAQLITPTNEATLISARRPMSPKRLEDPDTEILTSDLASTLKGSPGTIEKNLRAMTQYPNFKGRLRSNSRPENIMSEVMEVLTSNMQFVYEQMPPHLREATKHWYEGANKIATGLAKNYEIPREAASGVIAALSPQNPWDNNLAAAERVIDTWKYEQGTKFTPEMEQWYLQDKAARKAESPWDQSDDLIGKIRGKRLQELETSREKAAWIRLYDQAHNKREYDLWTPDGKRAGLKRKGDVIDVYTQFKSGLGQNEPYTMGAGDTATMSWGSFGEIASAVDILDNPTLMNISNNIGKGHKVRNFYNNIENPMSAREFYTSDTHNVSGALLQPLGGSSLEVSQSFGGKGSGQSAITGHKGTYSIYQEAGARTARENKLLPREMQSITWESIRNIFKNKSAPVKAAAKRIWEDYARGRETLPITQDRILELAGGFKTPDWAQGMLATP